MQATLAVPLALAAFTACLVRPTCGASPDAAKAQDESVAPIDVQWPALEVFPQFGAGTAFRRRRVLPGQNI